MTPKATQTHPTVPPKVTVILSTYNRARLLPHAIRSIINQTFTDWELIIVDDASSDTTEQVVRAFIEVDSRIRYHRHKNNSGLAVARNTSFQLARGRYIAFQDDDDLSLPTRLEKQVHFLDAHPDTSLVATWRRNFNRDNLHHVNLKLRFASHADNPANIHDIAVTSILSSPTLMARSQVFTETPMRPFFTITEDLDFVLRCIERYTIRTIQEALYHYRLADPGHITLSTAKNNLLRCWCYHCLAWASSFHRRMGWRDPIDDAHTIDDAFNNFHPQFHARARHSLKKLTHELMTILLNNPQPHTTYPTLRFINKLAGKRITVASIRRLLLHPIDTRLRKQPK